MDTPEEDPALEAVTAESGWERGLEEVVAAVGTQRQGGAETALIEPRHLAVVVEGELAAAAAEEAVVEAKRPLGWGQ